MTKFHILPFLLIKIIPDIIHILRVIMTLPGIRWSKFDLSENNFKFRLIPMPSSNLYAFLC